MNKSRFVKVASFAAAALAIAAPAMAVPILDLSAVGTAVTAELAPALASAMPIAGTLIAVGVGWKLFQRFVR
jgi:hypothetical protein